MIRIIKNNNYWLLAILLMYVAGCNTIKSPQFSTNKTIAHRGAWKTDTLPQNSIASLRKAITLNATGTEFDVRMTADEKLIINHDPFFFGDTIELKSYKELATRKLKNGEKLPTLKQYLKAGKKNNLQTRLVLEVKPSITDKKQGVRAAEKSVALVKKMKAENFVVYISFDFEILKRIHAIDPAAATQYLTGDKSPAELKEAGITGLDYHYSVYKQHPEWIEQARQLGLILNAWTVNDAETMDWLLAQNFNFITTDHPELLLERVKIFPVNNPGN